MKYSNFANIFFSKLASAFSEYIKINDYVIELINQWQLFYRSIYSLKPIKLETLKTYIKTNLANNFIRLFKSPVKALIFFDKKLDWNFWLCINYQKLNNFIMKNWYLLYLVKEFLD